MFIKNYTSDVPVSQTVYRIEQVLIRCGVSGITKEYGKDGAVIAVHFSIQPSDSMPAMSIRLPANTEKALNAIWMDYVDGDKLTDDGQAIRWNARKKKRKADFRQQAERTAWKIIQDWVEVQMSMIQMEQAEYREVFLSYVWDGRQTLYQRIKEAGFAGLALPEKT